MCFEDARRYWHEREAAPVSGTGAQEGAGSLQWAEAALRDQVSRRVLNLRTERGEGLWFESDQDAHAALEQFPDLEGLVGFVYFIAESSSTGPRPWVKIGRTGGLRFTERLSNLQTGNPRELSLAAVVMHDEGFDLGGHLHEVFRRYRGRGEWFRMCARMEAYIQQRLDSTHRMMARIAA